MLGDFVEVVESPEETESTDHAESEDLMLRLHVILQVVNFRSFLFTSSTSKDSSGVGDDEVSRQVPGCVLHLSTQETRMWIPSRRRCWVIAWCVNVYIMMLQMIIYTYR